MFTWWQDRPGQCGWVTRVYRTNRRSTGLEVVQLGCSFRGASSASRGGLMLLIQKQRRYKKRRHSCAVGDLFLSVLSFLFVLHTLQLVAQSCGFLRKRKEYAFIRSLFLRSSTLSAQRQSGSREASPTSKRPSVRAVSMATMRPSSRFVVKMSSIVSRILRGVAEGSMLCTRAQAAELSRST